MENLSFNEYISLVSEKIGKRDYPMTACVHSYGCQLNFSDGEKIKGMLMKMGFDLIPVLLEKMLKTEFSAIWEI